MSEEIVLAPEWLREEIYNQLEEIMNAEQGLEHGYARFASLIVRFKKTEAWRDLGYRSFDAFMEELKERYHRGRTQLYNYVGVAEKLLPLVSEKTLNEIGISKAIELKRAVSSGGKITESVIETARNPKTTIKELRAILQGAYNLPENERPGTWFDFGGTYLTAEEKAAFTEACKIAMTVLELSKAQPEWAQRKAIMLAFAQEFTAAHAPSVYGPKGE
jgi:hypothetical protein